MASQFQRDQIGWEAGREGYLNVPVKPIYAPFPKTGELTGPRSWFGIQTEVRLGSLISAGGMVWTTYVATSDYAALWHMQILPPGPIEVCALGILVWLHAKWRRSTSAG